ncbi:MAG TPA: hypothetical protein DCQ31_04900 [Bacteroidales bacterium]|nr:hypothetical protein [Bacteroidales bacterium]
MFIKKTLLYPLACSVLFFGACKTEGEKDENLDNVAIDEQTTDAVETFYQVPSPEDLFVFVKAGNLPYNQELLNPIGNIGKYVDTRSKELNFGVYTADLAYSAAFHKYQESLQKLESIRKMSDEIGISAVFDEALEKRVKNIFTNSDSLINITSASYYNIVDFLESNDRGKTLALLSAGGWIESLYIVTNLITDFNKQQAAIQHIADQKLSFENLVLYLKKYEYDENIQLTLTDIMEVQNVFSSLEVVQVSEKEKKKSNTGGYKVGGTTRIKITEAQFKELKEKIVSVRNKITGNSVTL